MALQWARRAVVLEAEEEAQRRKPKRFLVVNFGKGTGTKRLATGEKKAR